jgi:hypothetical protein
MAAVVPAQPHFAGEEGDVVEFGVTRRIGRAVIAGGVEDRAQTLSRKAQTGGQIGPGEFAAARDVAHALVIVKGLGNGAVADQGRVFISVYCPSAL